MAGQGGKRRWLIGVAAALLIAITGGLVVGFKIPPAASTDEMPRSVTAGGVVYGRVALVTLNTTVHDSVTVHVPPTTRPIVVIASCRLAFLHTSRALSALTLDLTPAMLAGGDVPDTQGVTMFACPYGEAKPMHKIDSAWLPRDGDQLRLRWRQMDSYADTPSDSPASWAFAVYVPS
jgi:hypothetical protein